MRYARIKDYDVSNGPGIRVSVYLQGCPHACVGCFNPKTWDPYAGIEVDSSDFLNNLKNLLTQGPVHKDLSILGGEPFSPCNIETTLNIVQDVKSYAPQISIWIWTGYILEESCANPVQKNFLQQIIGKIDIIIDGRFEIDKKDLTLKYAGSTNQRVLVMSEYPISFTESNGL